MEPEMSKEHAVRVESLLLAIGADPAHRSPMGYLAAYQTVLTKDLLWAMTELLQYKQNEVRI